MVVLYSSQGSDGDDAEIGVEEGSTSSARPSPKPFLTRRMRRQVGPKKDGGTSSAPPSSSPEGSSSTEAVVTKASNELPLLKVSKKWACIAGCGACCYLNPSERPYLMDYFDDPDDLALYNSLVGEDGWCMHFDKEKRACTIFQDRPWFCRVEGETFDRMYGVPSNEMDKFCTSCCREQIGDVYGVASPEMVKFNTAIKALKAVGKDDIIPVPVDPFDGSEKPENKADWI